MHAYNIITQNENRKCMHVHADICMHEQLQWPLPQTAYQLLSCHGGYDKSTRKGEKVVVSGLVSGLLVSNVRYCVPTYM